MIRAGFNAVLPCYDAQKKRSSRQGNAVRKCVFLDDVRFLRNIWWRGLKTRCQGPCLALGVPLYGDHHLPGDVSSAGNISFGRVCSKVLAPCVEKKTLNNVSNVPGKHYSHFYNTRLRIYLLTLDGINPVHIWYGCHHQPTTPLVNWIFGRFYFDLWEIMTRIASQFSWFYFVDYIKKKIFGRGTNNNNNNNKNNCCGSAWKRLTANCLRHK